MGLVVGIKWGTKLWPPLDSNRDCELLVPYPKLTTTANVTIDNQTPFYAQYNPFSTFANHS